MSLGDAAIESGTSKKQYSIYLLFCIGYYSEAFAFFYSERIAIDLTKKRVGGILKEMEMPEHWVISTFLAKSRPTFSTHRAALFFTLFYRVDKRVPL